MTETDYIIVGQGLAGTLLGYFLEKSGKRILFIDNAHQSAASNVAAGIMNPITGRKFVKSWMVDELFPFAKNIYAQMEKEFSLRFFHEKNIVRELYSVREENEWLIRSGYPDYFDFYEEESDLGNYKGKIEQHTTTIELKQSGRLDIPLLITTFEEKWKREEKLIQEKFDFDKIELKEDAAIYKDIKCSKIIFCEGFQAKSNPYFSDLNYEEAKGEMLIIKIPDSNFQKILKHKLYLVPLGEDKYWAGASNEWRHEDDNVSEKNYKYLKNKLEEILNTPFEILDHKAAIRPTNKDRKPLLGLHYEFPQLAIFNGLGSKGSSVGPYWANEMSRFLLENKELDKVVNIKRIYDKKK